MNTPSHQTISRLPASRFPDPADLYFCDNCGRDLTKNLHRDRTPVWQPLRPLWYECQCGRKYLSGAAEWDDLTGWERSQRIRQLRIGFALFAFLVTPVALAYLALRYGGAALVAVVGIALIPSVLVAKPLWFVLVDLCEIVASVWRTRRIGRNAFPARTIVLWIPRLRPQILRLITGAAALAVLIVASRWTPSHLSAAPPMSALSLPETSNAARLETSVVAVKLPSSIAAQAAVGAPGPAFRRVQVGPNEVDFIADDVTIRHFLPSPARRRRSSAYKEVHFGEDVTIRYFASNPAVAPQTPPLSLDQSLPLSQ